MGLIPASGRSPGGGHGDPPHYSCPENSKNRGTWWATVRRVADSQTQLKWLSMHLIETWDSFQSWTIHEKYRAFIND